MLIITALSWMATYSLDFFMTSGINIDPGMQKSALQLADFCAGLAALAAPAGSQLLLGGLLRVLGLAAVLCVALGLTGAAKLGSLAGPAVCVLICAREIFWFGLSFKVDALASLALFACVLFLRGSLVFGGMDQETMSAGNLTGTSGRDISLLRENEIQWLSRWQELELPPYTGSVPPVGAPLPVSFSLSASMAVLSLGKVLESIGEDLDEEGEQFFKRSSAPLYGAESDGPRPGRGKEPKQQEEP